MKIADRMFGIRQEMANDNNPHYELYRAGVKAASIGLLATAGGAVTGVLGVEFGYDIAMSGSIVSWGGSVIVLNEVGSLRNSSNVT